MCRQGKHIQTVFSHRQKMRKVFSLYFWYLIKGLEDHTIKWQHLFSSKTLFSTRTLLMFVCWRNSPENVWEAAHIILTSPCFLSSSGAFQWRPKGLNKMRGGGLTAGSSGNSENDYSLNFSLMMCHKNIIYWFDPSASWMCNNTTACGSLLGRLLPFCT